MLHKGVEDEASILTSVALLLGADCVLAQGTNTRTSGRPSAVLTRSGRMEHGVAKWGDYIAR
jgi:hypothetical protein